MAFLAPALSAIGSGAGTAATAAGSALGSIPGVGAAESALGSLGSGLGSLFTGGAPSEAGYLASLGQAVPQGVELAGPSSTFTGPGFFGSFMQGFHGAPQALADPSAASATGQGLGQLFSAIGQMKGAANSLNIASMPPPVNLPPSQQMGGPATRVTPVPPNVTAQQGPIMHMIGQLFAGF